MEISLTYVSISQELNKLIDN